MAAVASSTGLDCPDDGLAFPPAGLHDLAHVFRPAADGERLARGSMWRPFHMIGLETSISVLSAVLRGEPAGTAREFRSDAMATAKRDLQVGEMLDGEGGCAEHAAAAAEQARPAQHRADRRRSWRQEQKRDIVAES